MKTRYHYRFKGQVQGVGFRWTARMLAEKLDLTGWVENMWDGSVEMEIQGDEETIDSMVAGLQQGRYIEIYDIERTKLPVIEDEYYFVVTH